MAVNRITNQAIIANNKDDTITIIDLSTNSVIAAINTGQGPQAAPIDEVKNIAIITNERADTVTIVDLSTRTIKTTIPAGKSQRVQP